MASASSSSSSAQVLSTPVKLPCGRVVPNRLCKAPMVEMQAPFGGGPLAEKELRIYQEWADGGWGMIITGNIAIDETHLGTPWDVNFKKSLPSQHMEQFKRYATVCKSGKAAGSSNERPLAVVQLVHAGRQSGRGAGRAPWKPSLAPSAVPMATAKGALPWPISSAFDWFLWGSCRAMTTQEVQQLVQRFADSAQIVHDAGFDGVELHGSHGYMLAAFLSPRTNQRTDQYGGNARNRFRIVEEIVREVRRRVPEDFVVGIKLNSADYVQGGLTEDDALLNVKWLAELGGCDFVEISGGNYENPSFMMHDFDAESETAKLSQPDNGGVNATQPAKVKESTKRREAFFAGFANRAASVLPESKDGKAPMALMVTGGLRSRRGCASAIEHSSVSLCGIARASALDPDLPLKFCDPKIDDDAAAVPIPKLAEHPPALMSLLPLKLAGAGWTTLYHAMQMARMVNGKEPDAKAGSWELLKGFFFAPHSRA